MEDAMSVRAKFQVQKIESSHYTKYKTGPDGKPDYNKTYQMEMRTIHMNPVYGNGDPKNENTKFGEASPSGGLTLGTINSEAWKHFELGGGYYLDFTPAPRPEA
jgi:hypothetical protein